MADEDKTPSCDGPGSATVGQSAQHSSNGAATVSGIESDGCDVSDVKRDLSISLPTNGDHQQYNTHSSLSNGPATGASHGGSVSSKSVCRDFLRNVCFRGSNCKFAHPGGVTHGDLVFCHDFQNLGCNRYDCKFIHASKDDELKYLESGKLPPSARNVGSVEANHEPICKDFLKRQCHRGKRCKYRHEVSSGGAGEHGVSFATNNARLDSDRRLYHSEVECYGTTSGIGTASSLLLLRDPADHGMGIGATSERSDRYSPLRTLFGVHVGGSGSGQGPSMASSQTSVGGGTVAKRRRASLGPSPLEDESSAGVGSSSPVTTGLDRENRILRMRVEDLQKQVKDLMSTNEFLLQQNAELRLAKQQQQQQAAVAQHAQAAQAQQARACPAAMPPGAVMSGAVISGNMQQQLAAANSVLTNSVLQSVQPAVGAAVAGGCALAPSGVLSGLGPSLQPLASSLQSLGPGSAVLNAAAAAAAAGNPITSEPVGLVPVSSIITISSSSSTEPLVAGYPIVTSQGQLHYNPARP